MISEKSMVKCQWCMSQRTVEEWDKDTLEKCISRQMRRKFKSLTQPITWVKKTKSQDEFFYVCGKCKQWSKGCQLILLNDKGERVLGGESIMHLVKDE